MVLEGTEDEELKEALEYMKELRRDPQKFNARADRVIDGWLKRERGSARRSRVSRHV